MRQTVWPQLFVEKTFCAGATRPQDVSIELLEILHSLRFSACHRASRRPLQRSRISAVGQLVEAQMCGTLSCSPRLACSSEEDAWRLCCLQPRNSRTIRPQFDGPLAKLLEAWNCIGANDHFLTTFR